MVNQNSTINTWYALPDFLKTSTYKFTFRWCTFPVTYKWLMLQSTTELEMKVKILSQGTLSCYLIVLGIEQRLAICAVNKAVMPASSSST